MFVQLVVFSNYTGICIENKQKIIERANEKVYGLQTKDGLADVYPTT